MYPVSQAFQNAIDRNARRYYWTGVITTKGGQEYTFDNENIIKGSGYITRSCCGNSSLELGTVYASEMGITLLSDIDRYTLEGVLLLDTRRSPPPTWSPRRQNTTHLIRMTG